MLQRLLIAEEALRDFKAHWFEYIKTITQAANAENWSVDVACNLNVDPQIQKAFPAFAIFRYSRYLDTTTQKLPGERYYGFILHSLRCLKVLWPFLSQQEQYDHIFVPTVLFHHLLGWWIIANFHPNKPKHITLFFVTNPGRWDQQIGSSCLPKSAQVQKILLQSFGKLVQQGKVTLGVETKGAKKEFETLTALPFVLLPHPVPRLESSSRQLQNSCEAPNFACYGFARHEKGSDIFKAAVTTWLKANLTSTVQFRIQWTQPFPLPDGSICEPGDLLHYSQVKVIDRPLISEEYQALLHTTGCMILPYRNSSYYARVSRIAIECAYLGIPMIYTRGGWLEEFVSEFGAGIGIEDENVDSLLGAINLMLSDYIEYRQKSLLRQENAQEYFSGKNFCQMLLQQSN